MSVGSALRMFYYVAYVGGVLFLGFLNVLVWERRLLGGLEIYLVFIFVFIVVFGLNILSAYTAYQQSEARLYEAVSDTQLQNSIVDMIGCI